MNNSPLNQDEGDESAAEKYLRVGEKHGDVVTGGCRVRLIFSRSDSNLCRLRFFFFFTVAFEQI